MKKIVVKHAQRLSMIIIFPCVAMFGCGKTSSDTSVQSVDVSKSAEEVKLADEKRPQIEKEKRAHEAHALVKPGAAVNLKSRDPLSAVAPGVYEYRVVLISPNHAGKMTIDVSTSADIAIVSSERHFEFELQPNGEYGVPLTLSADVEGRFYIQLHVSVTADGESSTRVIAVILQVGEPTVKAQKTAEKSSGEESDTVISLPAQETISPH